MVDGMMGQDDVEIVAVAELTEDMVRTLVAYFDGYAVDGVLAIEISDKGLWLPNPSTGGRQFLGLARLPGDHHA